ncbi:MAG TPA: hypothetical protein PLA00_03435, partial [Syntrophorhabdaceae bacterium]|nr:hypothetical protein [Syntrophorhabdaceae bacterium]
NKHPRICAVITTIMLIKQIVKGKIMGDRGYAKVFISIKDYDLSRFFATSGMMQENDFLRIA